MPARFLFQIAPLRVLLVVAGLVAAPLPAVEAAPLNAGAVPLDVVVTIPVLKDLAERVGGSHVRVVSLLSGLESEHTYSPKPSDLVAVRKARVLLEVGVGLEVWVGSLVNNAGNADLLRVTTSRGIVLIRDHEGPSRGLEGERHEGNPHVWLDPENVKIMLAHITEAFSRVDPAHAADYRSNQAAYVHELDRLQAELADRLRGVSRRQVIVHHPAWPYFARRFGFEVAGEIVAQPGAEPSARHVQTLVARIRRQGIRVIVSEPQLNHRIPELLARETGARVVLLTPLPGGLPGTDTYLDMLRYDVLQLAQALEAR